MELAYNLFSLRITIQTCALTTVLMSSFFLVRGAMSLSVNDIAKIAGTYFGHNPNLLRNLCSQKIDYIVGWILLLLSFFLQTGNFLWPMTIDDIGYSNNIGVAIGICITIVIGIISYFFAKRWKMREIKKAEKLLDDERQDTASDHK